MHNMKNMVSENQRVGHRESPEAKKRSVRKKDHPHTGQIPQKEVHQRKVTEREGNALEGVHLPSLHDHFNLRNSNRVGGVP